MLRAGRHAMAVVNEGNLVRIRPIEEDDLEPMRAWRMDSRALGGFNPPSLATGSADRERLLEATAVTEEYARLAIETVSEGRLVGMVGYTRDTPSLDTAVRTFSGIAEPYDRGKGYATEARVLLVNYLFLTTRLERIYSETEARNEPACRSLEKCGMSFEGVLRHLLFDLGQWKDMAVYSILRHEWKASPLYAPYRDAFVEPWF
jgi:RimJ/RimL family protein N-acetyltransferase